MLGRPNRCTTLEAGGATSSVTRRQRERTTTMKTTRTALSKALRQETRERQGLRNAGINGDEMKAMGGSQENNCDGNNETCSEKGTEERLV